MESVRVKPTGMDEKTTYLYCCYSRLGWMSQGCELRLRDVVERLLDQPELSLYRSIQLHHLVPARFQRTTISSVFSLF